MRILNLSKLYLFCFIFIFCTACSQNEAQQQFEEEAVSVPSGIQELDASGSPVKGGETDPGDWHIAPDFSGLIEVWGKTDTIGAYPNPVSLNSSFEIQINVKVVDAVNGLYIYAFRNPGNNSAPLAESLQGTLQPGGHSIRINSREFAQNGGTNTIDNTYRIIIRDNRQKVITYGDVRVL